MSAYLTQIAISTVQFCARHSFNPSSDAAKVLSLRECLEFRYADLRRGFSYMPKRAARSRASDGTIGTLSTSPINNFVDWKITITIGTQTPVTLTGPLSGNNSSINCCGADGLPSASVTDLTFPFGNAGSGGLLAFGLTTGGTGIAWADTLTGDFGSPAAASVGR